jgi:hypothetical protein
VSNEEALERIATKRGQYKKDSITLLEQAKVTIAATLKSQKAEYEAEVVKLWAQPEGQRPSKAALLRALGTKHKATLEEILSTQAVSIETLKASAPEVYAPYQWVEDDDEESWTFGEQVLEVNWIDYGPSKVTEHQRYRVAWKTNAHNEWGFDAIWDLYDAENGYAEIPGRGVLLMSEANKWSAKEADRKKRWYYNDAVAWVDSNPRP